MRRSFDWASDRRLLWLVVGAFLVNLLMIAVHLLHASGPVWAAPVNKSALSSQVADILWALAVLVMVWWAVSFLRLTTAARMHLTAGMLGNVIVELLGLSAVVLSDFAFSEPWFRVAYFVSRTAWALISMALVARGMVKAVGELRGVRYERDNLQLVLSFSESVSLMAKQDILNETVNVVRRLTDADACLLFLLDPAEDVLKVAASYFDEQIYDREYINNMVNFPCPRGWGLTGRVLVTGEPYLARDTTKEESAKCAPGSTPNGAKTTLLLPMKVQGRVSGVLRVTRVGVDQMSEAQVTVCSILGNHAAVAMDAGNLYHEVLQASRTDVLTGLANARAFREALESAVDRKESFALLMVDADSLKRVNDTLGHQSGDRLLQGLAGSMVAAADGRGTAFRYAGDEFMLILPGLHPIEGQEVGERIRRDLAAMQIETPEGVVETTVSIGVAGYPMDGQDAESLMRAADQAMYHAKQAGKNQVQLAS